MFKITAPKILKNDKFQRFLVLFLTFVLLSLISFKSVIPQKYDLQEGQQSPVDIKSPREFVDEIATQEKSQMAVSGVPLQYTKDNDLQNEAINKINQFFSLVLDINTSSLSELEKINKLKETKFYNLTESNLTVLIKLDSEKIKSISNYIINSISDISKKDIMQNDEATLENIRLEFKSSLDKTAFENNIKEIIYTIGASSIKPNMFFDVKKTNELQDLVKKQVEPVVIRKNQIIVSKGDTINSYQMYLLNKAGVLKSNSISDINIYISVLALVAIVEILILLYLTKFKKEAYESINKFTMIFLTLTLNALFVIATYAISPYLIPIALMPILLTLIFEQNLAMYVFIISSMITAVLTNFNLETFVVYLFGGLIGTIYIYKAHDRSNIMLSGFLIGIFDSLIILSIGLLNGIEITQIIINMSYGIAGGLISSILSIGIMPIFEQIFDIVTPIKLMELSNPNLPLLKKILFEAPGTYHHSILVGNLAEAAAEAIGANSLLARVGAYYHDIGKIKRPYFFKENQITNDNPHDNLTPKLSAMIISAHVKDGIELANHYKLPEVIKQIIQEHHGTTLIKYFYVMEKNNSLEEVDESNFRYPGPKPRSKEAAIVMLADCVEAALRSLGNITVADIENMVNKLTKEKMDEGQFDECNLTLREILIIKKSFINVLQGIFHSRIEYPEIAEQKVN
ncbi:7TM-HD extracellular [Caloramator mitchellensis]|uniref:7TM-HD extracellular n=1 Tax=Caloramator mitchellensis TaxID=908809 RepID=A0A0R3JUF2_CALMK|nr:HDIG domain-containing metalloprotein [Caloramator mitchellensis]KRQ86650.1 7TM-HD extracellular [Caloramator mitchellensis]